MTQWYLLFIGIQCIHFLSTFKLYIKAGRRAWEAAIPIYNAIILMRIINRPKWWVILLFVPVINLIMFPVIWVETARSFGKNKRLFSLLAIGTFGFYITYLNYTSNTLNYKKDRSQQPKAKVGELVSSILFAIIAATIVHTYFIQPFTIPSSSLEKTLLVGDYLFVSKFHYGARIPMTTFAAPMVHDTIPIIKKKSYLFNDDFTKKKTSLINKLQLPYFRLPGFQKIKRNSIVVFNQPADTLLDMNDFHPDRNYYKPIDKKTNLAKRCVAIPGDSLEIKDGYVFINGKQTILPDRAKPQYNFFIDTGGKRIAQTLLVNRYGAREGFQYANGNFALTKSGGYILTLTDNEAKSITNNRGVKNVIKLFNHPKGTDGDIFPHIPSLGWNTDNFGPIYIPKKGKTVALNNYSIPIYKRIIQEYENNNLTVFNDEIYINGKRSYKYTFKQNYYWMMGDNRQNSIDSRAWGFVPFDHIVGKPVFIWFSWNTDGKGIHKIRWDRMFTTVSGTGKPTSYFLYFIILIVVYYVFKYLKN